ncbi:MAG: DUF2147 domain-containing protein [Bacteroidia bacterium]|nr:DUF2147 domain-containing protein [Bacteroidia bacterium]
MKTFASIFILLLSLAGLQAQTAPAGVWNTGQDNTLVEITNVEGRYVGKLISSDSPNAKIGNLLLKDLKPNGGAWKGQLYAPKRSAWYDATVEVKGNRLVIKAGSGFTSKTVEWTRK